MVIKDGDKSLFTLWNHKIIIENDVGRNNAAGIHPLRREFRMPTRGDVRTPVIYGSSTGNATCPATFHTAAKGLGA